MTLIKYHEALGYHKKYKIDSYVIFIPNNKKYKIISTHITDKSPDFDSYEKFTYSYTKEKSFTFVVTILDNGNKIEYELSEFEKLFKTIKDARLEKLNALDF